MKKLATLAVLALSACGHSGSPNVGKILAFQPPHSGAPCVKSGACVK